MKTTFRIGKTLEKINNKLQNMRVLGKTQPVVVLVPYGMFMNPPENTAAGILADQCNEESLYGIPFEIDLNNLEDLKEGETAFGIPGKTARVKFFDNDKVGIYNSLISMLQIQEGLIDQIKAITTTGTAAAQAVSPASQAQLELYKLEVQKLLNGA